MPLRSSIVGTTADPIPCEMTTRRLQAYAAGTGDANPHYLRDDRAGGIVAPPAICVSLEWPAQLAAAARPDRGVTRDEGLRGVHALQDSIFHRPIRPGDVLHTRAQVAAVRRTRAGAWSLLRIDTIDAADTPVVTSFSGSILRGVEVEGTDRSIEEPPEIPGTAAEALTEKATLDVAPEAAHVYTECAQIWNPIHTERLVAQAAGLPDIILHGTASWALAGREIVNRVGNADPTRLSRLRGRFRAMVLLGTSVTLHFATTRLAEGAGIRVDFRLENDAGEPAVDEGVALLSP